MTWQLQNHKEKHCRMMFDDFKKQIKVKKYLSLDEHTPAETLSSHNKKSLPYAS